MGDYGNYTDADEEEPFNKESLIRYYFDKGFEYNDILNFLEKYHQYTISYIECF